MADQDLVKALKDKLAYDYKSANFLNTISPSEDKIDLNLFELISEELSQKIIQKLVHQNSFKQKISFNSKKANKNLEKVNKLQFQFKNILHQNQLNKQSKGLNNLSIGYPLLIRRSKKDNTLISAPLLLWKIDIRQDLEQANQYIIEKNKEHDVIWNRVLLNLIEKEDNTTFKEQSFFSNYINKENLAETLAGFLTFLNPNLPSNEKLFYGLQFGKPQSVKPFYHYDQLTGNNNWIEWSGVISLYELPKSSIVNNYEQILQKPDKLEEPTSFFQVNHIPFPAIELDPYQQNVLHALKDQAKIVIEGPPGTGKSQVLTAILLNKLLNRKPVVLVSEKTTALQVIQKRLCNLGFENEILRIEDIYSDRYTTVKKIKDKTLRETEDSKQDSKTFENELNRLKLLEQKALVAQNLYEEKIFEDKTFIDLSLEKFDLEKKSDNLLYTNYIEHKHFVSNINELSITIKKILPLIKPSILEYDWKSQKTALISDFNRFHEAQMKYNQAIGNLEKALINNIQNIKELTHKKANDLKRSIKETEKLYSKRITQTYSPKNHLSFKGKIMHLFSSKYKAELAAYKKKLHLETELTKTKQSAFYSIKTNLPIKEYTRILATEKIVADYINQSTEKKIAFKSTCSKLQVLSIKIDTQINKEDIISELDQIDWSNFNEGLKSYQDVRNTSEGNLITTLLPLKNSFKRYQKLHQEVVYRNTFIKLQNFGNKQLNDFISLLQKFESNQIEQIKKYFNEKFISQLEKHTQKELNFLLRQKNSSKSVKLSLKELFSRKFEFITSGFPILLLNPETASQLLPLEINTIETVMFDEASQLKIEDVYPILLRAKQIVIAGDSKQMPPLKSFDFSLNKPSEENNWLASSQSLLDYAKNNGYKSYSLKYHYRSQTPSLIQFSNQKFYADRLIPIQQKISNHINLNQIDGIYENHQNIHEARAMLQRIKSVSYNKSILVITSNAQQRELFLDLFYAELSINEELRNKFNQWKKTGFSVRNLEQIQGEEADVVLISLTYGKNKQGEFKKRLGYFNLMEGPYILNVLVTRAKEQIEIFTSIPKEIYFGKRLEKEKPVDVLFEYLQFVSSMKSEIKISNPFTNCFHKIESNTWYDYNLNNKNQSVYQIKFKNTLATHLNTCYQHEFTINELLK